MLEKYLDTTYSDYIGSPDRISLRQHLNRAVANFQHVTGHHPSTNPFAGRSMEPRISKGAVRCLVIDDSETDCILIRRHLKRSTRWRFDITIANSIEGAIDLIRREQFDVAMVDYFLGADYGTRFIETAGGRNAPFPIILLTGLGAPRIDETALAAGASDYLEKQGLSTEMLERTILYARERHRYERALREQREMLHVAKMEAEQANEAKSRFLASMSHELRTPLNAVLGLSECMAMELFGPIGNEKYKGYAENILAGGRYLLELITDILEYSNADYFGQTLEKKTVHIPEIITDTVRLLSAEARRLDLELKTEVEDELPPILASERGIKQILLNLLSNSFKFTPKGGRVTISAFKVKDKTALCVEDTGAGMTAQEMKTIFVPFEASMELPYSEKRGIGLGLATVKTLVDLHDGRILVHSAPNEGAKFTIIFPGHKEESASVPVNTDP